MGKTIVIFLASVIFVSHCYVLKGKGPDNKQDHRREKRSCHACDEFGPYGPPPPPPAHGHPPPPPFFRTQNWSGLARSDDGFHQGVFSGAAASAVLESENTEQAFSIASSNTGAGAEGMKNGNGVASGSQNSAGFSGQQNEGLPGTYRKSHYSYQDGKHFVDNGEFAGGQQLGGQQQTPKGIESQQQVKEQASHSAGFGGQSGANSQAHSSAENDAGFVGQQNGPSSSYKESHFLSSLGGKHYLGLDGPTSEQNFGGQQHVHGSSGSKQQVREQASSLVSTDASAGTGIQVAGYGGHSTGFSGQSVANSLTLPSAGNDAALGGESGAGFVDQQNGKSSNYKESQYTYQGNKHFVGYGRSADGKGSDSQQQFQDGFESKQQVQGSPKGQKKIEDSFESQDKSSESQSASSQASFGAILSGHGQPANGGDQSVNSGGQSQIGSISGVAGVGSGFEATKGSNAGKSSGNEALRGALDLASQGLQTSQQTGASSCSTCGKSSYAFSNANSHSGNAVAVSIGG